MSRLIDANELQSEYKKYHDGKRSVLIDVAPTIDAVEVVRCKDCKMYDERPCGIVDYYNTANDFCSRGRRKDE